MAGESGVTDYEQLAADLTAAGIKATRESAYRMAERHWTGQHITRAETAVMDAWLARTLAEPWKPDVARQRGTGA